MGDFTTGDRYWIEEEDQKKKKKRLTEVFFLSAKNRSSVAVIFNEEFLVSVSHQLALITSLPFVHTARRSYRLNGPVKSSDCWVGFASYLSARSCLNLIIYYSEDGEVVTRFP